MQWNAKGGFVSPTDIAYLDIAALVIMGLTLMSLFMRHITKGPANRVYIVAMLLVPATAALCVAGEFYDGFITPAFREGSAAEPTALRDAITIAYYSLRSLTAPVYLILIATISGTTHLLNKGRVFPLMMWIPMIAVIVFVVTNPLHHLVYAYVNGAVVQGPLMHVLYFVATYYAVTGIIWLLRWRIVMTSDEFATLMMLYPLALISGIVQYYFPSAHVAMFITSVSMMLVAAFVIRPERHMDSHVDAASLQTYRELVQRAFITGKPLCLVYLEIVNLEQLRELIGKDEFANVTGHVAENLLRHLEHDDMLFYLRNGQFCIVPRNTDPDHALGIAQRAHAQGKASAPDGGARAAVIKLRTCIVRVPEDAPDIETLNAFVRRFAHLVPNSCVTTFSELSQHEGFSTAMALSDIVGRAIRKRTFMVYYQPIFCLHDGRFHSAEALVRLRDPEYGWVSPGLFIPEAEQNGALVVIGEILLEKICCFLGSIDYAKTGLDYVEVNLSADQCVRPQLADELIAVMEKYGVAPERINLEVTESSSAYSQEAIDENMRILAERGLTFSIDDYGTGYSNTSRVLKLPFSLVKIDKSFVDGMDEPNTRSVLADTVAMMKNIGKKVLVEGVETQEQADALAAMGVDYIQGYLYSKPLPEDEFKAFLIEHNKLS